MLHSTLYALSWLLLAVGVACGRSPEQSAVSSSAVPNVTHSGYLATGADDGSALFYTYYEAQAVQANKHTPVILWLQGGPGCASQFGNLYELGPQWLSPRLQLVPNPGAWNRLFGLLFIDQPVGTGFSISGSRSLPTDELEMAADLYGSLQSFFSKFPDLQPRPLVIAGESYAGKYVPSIGHFVLQQEQASASPRNNAQPLEHTRRIPLALAAARPKLQHAPLFHLAALAIGNGLTDPYTQVATHADTAHFMGLIDVEQRTAAAQMQEEAQRLIRHERWAEAHTARGQLLEYIARSSGVATLLNFARATDYDANDTVGAFLNQPAVKEALHAKANISFESCSEAVGEALGADVMKSVKHLVPDLLAKLPLLLYQGQYDLQDGAATSEAWIYALDWKGQQGFAAAPRGVWRLTPAASTSRSQQQMPAHTAYARRHLAAGVEAAAVEQQERGACTAGSASGPICLQCQGRASSMEPGAPAQPTRPAGYWKEYATLTHVVVAGAGHMVPRDCPLAAQAMLEAWLARALGAWSLPCCCDTRGSS